MRVIAPDMAGFGYTRVAEGVTPDRALWVRQLVDLLDALGLQQVSVVGNSFGGAIALALASEHPQRVRSLVLMGAVGVSFPLSEGLDKVWGYVPSHAAMRELLDVFVYDPSFITDDLVDMRYRASIRDDVQARFAALFPALDRCAGAARGKAARHPAAGAVAAWPARPRHSAGRLAQAAGAAAESAARSDRTLWPLGADRAPR